MNKDPVFNDNDWPIESRKKVIRSLPSNVFDCVQKIIAVSAKADTKEPPNYQQAIEQCIFQLPADRKAMNPLQHFKVLNVLAFAYVFDLKTDEARRTFFSHLFLGREANALNDPAAHENRISGLIRFSTLALQYPMATFFDILAEWLVKDDHYLKYAPSILSEICKGYLLRPPSWELGAFVEPMEEVSFEFSALAALHFITNENFTELNRTQIVSILGEWFSKRAADYLTFYSKYAHLAKDFALKRFPVLLKFTCTNGSENAEYERFHGAIIGLIISSVNLFAETPLDLIYLRSEAVDEVGINQRRRNDLTFVAKNCKLLD
uniref:Uncharacterized protein n=1 Tax=Panagrolaimus sp. PS1159 TaxID=55785 RepID=A0AC35EZ32_9BILA